MFHDEGTSYRKPSDWIGMKRVSEQGYVLDQAHQYGTEVSVIRSADGKVSHIVYGGRAFHKDR